MDLRSFQTTRFPQADLGLPRSGAPGTGLQGGPAAAHDPAGGSDADPQAHAFKSLVKEQGGAVSDPWLRKSSEKCIDPALKGHRLLST